jgi:hypothetical protein
MEATPQYAIAVYNYVDMICGSELQINTDDDKAKTILEDWNRKTDFYQKFRGLTTTCLATGNAILEKLDEDTLQDVLEVDINYQR